MRTIQNSSTISRNHWVKKFQGRLVKQDLSETTVRGYLYDIDYFRSWLVECHEKEPQLETLTNVDIAAYRQYLVGVKNMKASSVNRRIQAVKKLFQWAHKERLIGEDPAENIRFMKKSIRNRPNCLTDKEVHALLRAAGKSSHGLAKRNYALIQLILQSGLRIGEVSNLKLINLTINERSGFVRVADGKGHKEREVPLNAAARRALSTYFKTRDQLKPDDYVFNSKRNKPMSLRTLQDTVSQLSRRSHIERINASADTLRHTFAVNYLKNNPGKLVELATLMGHESLDTTAIYTRPSKEALAEDLERSSLNVC